MFPRKLSLALLALGLARVFADAPLPVLSVDEVLRIAAERSPKMIEAQLGVATYNADRFRGITPYLPIIRVNYQLGAYHEIRESVENADRYGGNYGIRAEEPIYHWGAVAARRKLGFAQEAAAEQRAVITYASLIQNLRKGYATLVLERSRMKLLEKRIEEKRFDAEKMKILVEQGHKSANDYEQYQIEMQGEELKLNSSIKQLERSLVGFRNESGCLDLKMEQLPTTLDVPEVDVQQLLEDYKRFTSGGFDKSPPSEMAHHEHRAIENQLTIVKANQKPGIDFIAGMTQGPTLVDNGYELQTLFFAGVGGTWNLFDRSETSQNKRSLLLRKRQVDTQLATTRAQLYADGKYNLELLDNYKQACDLRRRKLKLAKEAVEFAQLNFERGLINRQRLSEIEAKLLESESELVQEQVNLMTTYYTLLGNLFEDPAMRYFDPKKDNT